MFLYSAPISMIHVTRHAPHDLTLGCRSGQITFLVQVQERRPRARHISAADPHRIPVPPEHGQGRLRHGHGGKGLLPKDDCQNLLRDYSRMPCRWRCVDSVALLVLMSIHARVGGGMNDTFTWRAVRAGRDSVQRPKLCGVGVGVHRRSRPASAGFRGMLFVTPHIETIMLRDNLASGATLHKPQVVIRPRH